MAERFPILGVGSDRRYAGLSCPTWVPWEMLTPYEGNAKQNHDQTLKRLAERGGLCPEEAVAVIEGLDYRGIRAMTAADAVNRLKLYVAAHEQKEVVSLRAALSEAQRWGDDIRAVVDKQAADPALWFDAQYITEAYLQEALRKLHAVIEGG